MATTLKRQKIKQRGNYLVRLWAMSVDFMCLSIIGGTVAKMVGVPAGSTYNMPVMFGTFFAYYIGMEIRWGRTLGKMAFGLIPRRSGCGPEVKIPRWQWVVRTLLRLFIIPAVISWNRTTMIDLLSGIRYVRKSAPEPTALEDELIVADNEPALGWR